MPDDAEPPRTRYWPIFAIWAALFVIALVLSSYFEGRAENRVVYENTLNLEPLADAEASTTIFSDPLELNARQNLHVEARAPVDNSWAWVGGDLINEATGAVTAFELPVEYSHGYEGGEHWTEGSSTSDVRISALPQGRYTLRLEFLREQFQAPVEVEVNRLDNQMLVQYYEAEWKRLQRGGLMVRKPGGSSADFSDASGP